MYRDIIPICTHVYDSGYTGASLFPREYHSRPKYRDWEARLLHNIGI